MISNTVATEQLVQLGMRAAIRDIQDYVDDFAFTYEGHGDRVVMDVGNLKAYLLALLITAGIDASDLAA